MLPDGLRYVDSWVVDDKQPRPLLPTDGNRRPTLFEAWRERWQDLVEFEITPVITSAEAAARVDLTWPTPDQ